MVTWIAIAEALRRAAHAQDQGDSSWFLARRAQVSAAALPALGLTGSWAAFDWLMSAVPGWNMTSVGLYVLIGGFASALGVLAVVLDSARRQGVLPKEVGAAHSLALGRLLFAAVCLWAYIAVSQLIIVWIANIPREAAFYVPRARGTWRYLAALLIFGHFIVPFLLLLSRKWKERSAFVAALGGWIVLMHAVDVYWLIAPSASSAPSALGFGPFLLLGALALLVGVVRSSSEQAFPVRDPELARSLGLRVTMSDSGRLEQEPDLVPGLRLLRLVALALCVSALGVVGSWWMLRENSASHPSPVPVSSAAFAPGTPEQTPIETTERGLTLRAAQQKQLAGYGWVDRDAGIARIPIERAMDLRAEGVR